jgi:hypothetical protein
MQKITLNPSIATLLDIDSVGHGERVTVNFTANENWTGGFEFVVYNSIAKNSFVKPAGAITVVEKAMVLMIEPIEQVISVGAHYYEIVSISTKRVLFKGLLNIVK